MSVIDVICFPDTPRPHSSIVDRTRIRLLSGVDEVEQIDAELARSPPSPSAERRRAAVPLSWKI
ncbi:MULTISPECIES: hypothetical protein [unclassified Sinorhizobium]|uniref:hypothetical protein n=1 Tax=unclassified Sinorhizobium TaxID=2613772 RepID=UPI0024C44E76|nr:MULTISPECIES: hypothetical protein [unclassified Sinorhizobium]MDK1373989.1 hypothetical protein [Sinorhizobium sp. 6-70]MDK1477402.1 hypothetical protein [Sinorhizobium sp. 6-117]